MNRELLKKAIRKLVIQEITNNQLGTPDQQIDTEAEKALSKVESGAKTVPGTGKTVTTSAKHHVELSKNSQDLYDVVSITNGSDRRVAKLMSLDDAVAFAKKHAEESKKSYVEKAGEKSQRGFGIKPKEEKKSDKKPSDEMEETKEKNQVEISDKTDAKAEEKVDKKLAPITKDDSAPKGGDIVDKIEKIIDRVLKDKAEPKTAHLKADKEMESPDKLRVKDKGTPALKDSKK